MSTPTVRETGLILDGVALFSDDATTDAAARVPPKAILLVRYGKTAYTKGGERGEYDFTEADADKVLTEFTARQKDLVIDYEHETLAGSKAPAAGWIESLAKTAEGLVGCVRYWTKQARQFLQEGEYRYFSPVLNLSKKRPLSLHSVALTNHPATHGLPALVTSDDADTSPEKPATATQETLPMAALSDLAALAGVPVALKDDKPDEAATLAAIGAKIGELKATADATAGFLKLHDAPDLGALTGKIKGMVPAAELTALNDRLALIDAEKAVAAAFSARKLVEAQRPWALDYAKANPAGFAAFVAAGPAVAPAAAATVNLADGGNVSTDDSLALTDESLGKHFDRTPSLAAEGFTKASYAAFRKAEAAGLVRIANTKTAKE